MPPLNLIRIKINVLMFRQYINKNILVQSYLGNMIEVSLSILGPREAEGLNSLSFDSISFYKKLVQKKYKK